MGFPCYFDYFGDMFLAKNLGGGAIINRNIKRHFPLAERVSRLKTHRLKYLKLANLTHSCMENELGIKN